MSNADTVNSIFENLETILASEGLTVDDESSDHTDGNPYVRALYEGEAFENIFNERPEYNIISVELDVIRAKNKNLKTARTGMVELIHRIRSAITTDSLNSGDLAGSKLVQRVMHTGVENQIDFEDSKANYEITYKLEIRYRES